MSAAEAMVRGIPVVVSGSTGIGELVEQEGGGAVSSIDPQHIGSAILAIAASSSSLESSGRRASEVSRSRLSLSAFGTQLYKLYQELLAAGSRNHDLGLNA
jgi:glycosyltransferase involved in cell wall biosynthesis